jgi:hypothetical protein
MVIAIGRPKLEGNIAVGDDRQLGFAEFGDPQGRAIYAELYTLPGESHLAGLGLPRRFCTP